MLRVARPFASSYRLLTTPLKTVFLQRTFTSLTHAHAGRTQGHQLDRLTLCFSRQIMAALASKEIIQLIAQYSKTILILFLVLLCSSTAFAEGKPSELIFVMPDELAIPADKIPTINLLVFLGIPPFDKLDSNKTWYYTNGKQANIGSTWYHANGKQANI